MASDNQAKTDLLRELESLRAQLSDPDGEELAEERIPLLLDRVEQAVSGESAAGESADDAEAALRAAYQTETDDLQASETELVELAIARLKEDRQLIDEVLAEVPPEKQSKTQPDSTHEQASLFDEPPTSSKRTETPSLRRPAARGENPFLPKHIRDRLQERRQALAEDIAQAANFFPSTRSASTSRPPAEPARATTDEQLVDELVAAYLPLIEKDLRTRLMEKLRRGELDPKQPSDPT